MPKLYKPHVIIGKNINRLRNQAGLTQEKLSELADIDRRSLQRIEAGQWNMTVDYLERFCKVFGCLWSDLLKGLD